MLALIGILNEMGNVVCYLTDQSTSERDHTKENDQKAEQGNEHTGLADIRDHELNTACIQNHGNGAECCLYKAHLLCSVQGQCADAPRSNQEKDNVKQQNSTQDHISRIFNSLQTHPLK